MVRVVSGGVGEEEGRVSSDAFCFLPPLFFCRHPSEKSWSPAFAGVTGLGVTAISILDQIDLAKGSELSARRWMGVALGFGQKLVLKLVLSKMLGPLV